MNAKEKIREARKKLASMTEDERRQLVSLVGAIVTVEGRALSPHNTELILFQNSNATIVGGFNQWKAAGRFVKKGEHGLAIAVPANSKKNEAAEGQETEDDVYFFGATVFDISQTIPKEEANVSVQE